jgi:RND family efflux transporter MFP subunit
MLIVFCLLFYGQAMARDLDATTEWFNRVELSTIASGMVSHVNVVIGDTVSRGTVLIELDQRGLNSKLSAAESRLEEATQLNNEARRELNRALELFERTLLSDHERKLAEVEAASADAAYRQAEAKLVKIRLQQEYSRITAPFDGIVEKIHVQPGQAVINRNQAIPLLSLCESGRMKVITEIDERRATKLKSGTIVQVGVRGKWLDGEITRISLQPVAKDTNGSRYALEASFTPPTSMMLRAGERAVLRMQDE